MATIAETPTQKLNREAAEKKQAQEKSLELEKQSFSLEKLSEMSGHKVELLMVLQKTVAKDTTPAEFAYFLTVCKESGLSPVNKEIWCYKNSQGNLLVFTGKDGFLKKNKENPAYRGMVHACVCEHDQFRIDMVKNEIIEHEITNTRGKPIGAYCRVFYEGMKDTFVYIDFDEFNLGQAKWKTAPKMMIEKCAVSLALKEAAGITGIQNEEAFIVRNGAAVSAMDIPHENVKPSPPDSDEKSEERLLKMIGMCQDKDQLEALESECKSIASKEAYDARFAEL